MEKWVKAIEKDCEKKLRLTRTVNLCNKMLAHIEDNKSARVMSIMYQEGLTTWALHAGCNEDLDKILVEELPDILNSLKLRCLVKLNLVQETIVVNSYEGGAGVDGRDIL